MFKVGDYVRWAAAESESRYKNCVGTITAVIPNDKNLDAFAMYDVRFDFGDRTLYGTQLAGVSADE